MGQRFRSLVLLLVLSGVAILVGFSISLWSRKTPEIEPPSAIPGVRGRVRVEVLNAGGVPGVALDATRALRDQGFDVVLFGNAGTYSNDVSVVLDRVGQLETARLVAEALGVSQFRSEPDSTLFVDVTVRLGPEWTDPRSKVEGTEESAEPESKTSSGS